MINFISLNSLYNLSMNSDDIIADDVELVSYVCWFL